jgi:hypothetical protein
MTMNDVTVGSLRIAKPLYDFVVNEAITGEYDHVGSSIIYGDSVTEDTKIKTDSGEITIKELFDQCQDHSVIEGKEYGTQSFAKVIGFNAFEDSPVMSEISYVMRHKTKKKIYDAIINWNQPEKITAKTIALKINMGIATVKKHWSGFKTIVIEFNNKIKNTN